MRIHFLKHVPYEGPGTLVDWARERKHVLTGSEVYAGEPVPMPSELDALVVMGGPMSVHDEEAYPWLRDEKRLLRRWIAVGKPVLGICLGAQLIADALGAQVRKSRVREIGWFPVWRLPQLSLTAYDGVLPARLEAFHWHGDTFSIPAQAIPILSSEACPNQGFAYRDRVLALQCHLEMDPQTLDSMLAHTKENLAPSERVQPPEIMRGEGPRHYRAMRSAFFNLLDAWLEE